MPQLRGAPVNRTADIKIVYDQLCNTTECSSTRDLSLSDMILTLMKQHAEVLERLSISSVNDLVYCGVKLDDVAKGSLQTVSADADNRYSSTVVNELT